MTEIRMCTWPKASHSAHQRTQKVRNASHPTRKEPLMKAKMPVKGSLGSWNGLITWMSTQIQIEIKYKITKWKATSGDTERLRFKGTICIVNPTVSLRESRSKPALHRQESHYISSYIRQTLGSLPWMTESLPRQRYVTWISSTHRVKRWSKCSDSCLVSIHQATVSIQYTTETINTVTGHNDSNL